MAEELGVAERMKEARFRTAAERREAVSQAAMAELVSKAVKRAIHQTQWGRYETGESEPPLDVIRATARISGLSESYIAFGSPPAGPTNGTEPDHIRIAKQHGLEIATQPADSLIKKVPEKKTAAGGKRPRKR